MSITYTTADRAVAAAHRATFERQLERDNIAFEVYHRFTKILFDAVDVEVSFNGAPNAMAIEIIESHLRRQHSASRALDEVVSRAHAIGLDVYLYAQTFEPKEKTQRTLGQDELESWYRRHGFSEVGVRMLNPVPREPSW